MELQKGWGYQLLWVAMLFVFVCETESGYPCLSMWYAICSELPVFFYSVCKRVDVDFFGLV